MEDREETMSGEIIETGITWEHDTGKIVISTRSRKVAAKLRALGFESESEDRDMDYTTFRAMEDELRIGFRRRRRATAAQREVLTRMRTLRSSISRSV